MELGADSSLLEGVTFLENVVALQIGLRIKGGQLCIALSMYAISPWSWRVSLQRDMAASLVHHKCVVYYSDPQPLAGSPVSAVTISTAQIRSSNVRSPHHRRRGIPLHCTCGICSSAPAIPWSAAVDIVCATLIRSTWRYLCLDMLVCFIFL